MWACAASGVGDQPVLGSFSWEVGFEFGPVTATISTDAVIGNPTPISGPPTLGTSTAMSTGPMILTPEESAIAGPGNRSKGTVIGASVGSIFGTAFLLFILFLMIRYRQRLHRQFKAPFGWRKSHPEQDPLARIDDSKASGPSKELDSTMTFSPQSPRTISELAVDGTERPLSELSGHTFETNKSGLAQRLEESRSPLDNGEGG